MMEYSANQWVARTVRLAVASPRAGAAHALPPPTVIFVAGDRSQVGKSSTCLGVLGALHEKMGIPARDLAYIKPATQCEGTQLITRYCDAKGIENVGIGPVVFFSGFTRSFLAGEQGTSAELLDRCRAAVDGLKRGKTVCVVDGVGYPAVGSICGVSNAAMACALGAPVLLVGKKGVGDAVDSFNLNATFFESHGVKVLGGIFNRLPNDPSNYYSLDKCKAAVTSYFRQFRPKQMPYGFVPEVEALSAGVEAGTGAEAEAAGLEAAGSRFLAQASALIEAVAKHVDVARLLAEARAYCNGRENAADANPSALANSAPNHVALPLVAPAALPSVALPIVSVLPSSSSSSSTSSSSSSLRRQVKRKTREEILKDSMAKGAKRSK